MKDVGDDYDSIEFDFPPVEMSGKNQILHVVKTKNIRILL